MSSRVWSSNEARPLDGVVAMMVHERRALGPDDVWEAGAGVCCPRVPDARYKKSGEMPAMSLKGNFDSCVQDVSR